MKKPEIPYFELNKNQINELINLAQFKKGDIFYDLGCGRGCVVIEVAKTSVTKSIGIESSKKLYNKARLRLNQGIRRRKVKNFEKTDFWLSRLDNQDVDNDNKQTIDFSDAKVVFYSLDEDEYLKSDFINYNVWNKAKIIKKDIPLIGYDSEANRSNKDCWLFLTKPPYKKLSRKKWIKSVSDDFDSIDDLYVYYYEQLSKRFENLYLRYKRSKKYSEKMGKKHAESSLLQLKMSINNRYFYE